jgi:hypothetical protein
MHDNAEWEYRRFAAQAALSWWLFYRGGYVG